MVVCDECRPLITPPYFQEIQYGGLREIPIYLYNVYELVYMQGIVHLVLISSQLLVCTNMTDVYVTLYHCLKGIHEQNILLYW